MSKDARSAQSEKEAEGQPQYTKEYYDHYADGSYQSARAILPIVLEYITPRTLIDVGCGSGQWLRAARELGITEASGIDPNYKGEETDSIAPVDIAEIGKFIKKPYDLALCLEVAEHIDEKRADELIRQLCELAPAVLFSAAIPGQGGEGHVNEQWPEYWIEKFKARGLIPLDAIRSRVWTNPDVEPWYAQNAILFVKASRINRIATKKLTEWIEKQIKKKINDPKSMPRGDDVLPLVHPRKWAALRQLRPQTPHDVAHIYLGIPHAGSNEALMPNTICRACSARVTMSLNTQCSSSLTHNFNDLWCKALNARATHGITHFAMLHSDVRCLQDNWPDLLLEILEREQCDLLSVIIPIKDGRGLTSTAMDTDPWRPRRFTMNEIHRMPATFGNEDVIRDPETCRHAVGPILFNTGLWIARIDRPWAENVLFDIENRIRRNPDGQFIAEFEPEDWKFARWCHKAGIRYKVTREIAVEHIGIASYANMFPWGSQDIDESNIPKFKRMKNNEINIEDQKEKSVPCG